MTLHDHNSRALRLALSLLTALSPACATSPELSELVMLHRRGSHDAALAFLAEEDVQEELQGHRDGLLWRLEAGKICQDAAQFEESELHFRAADHRMREFDAEPTIRIGGELGGLISNPAARAYRGTEYDRVLLETYRVWNQLALGDLSEALVHCRRAYVRQAEAIERHALEIEEEQLAAREHEIKISELLNGDELGEAVAASRTRIDPAYANWVNPYASWLSAVLHWIDGDYSNAEVDLNKLAGMLPLNRGIRELLAEVEAGAVAEVAGMTRIFLIHEAGSAPSRISQSVVLETLRYGFTPIVFPVLNFEGPPAMSLDATGLDGRLLAQTETVADLEAIIANDYETRLAGVVIRAFLSVIVKEIATEALIQADRNEGDGEEGWGFLVGNLYKILSAGSDNRTWRSPSARIDVAELLIPAGSAVQLQLLDPFGTRVASYQTEPQAAPILFVRIRSQGAVVSIQAATLGTPITRP
jgi:hypothetical protein